MTGRHVSKRVEIYCPLSQVVACSTVTLGAAASLTGLGFTAQQVADTDFFLVEPHSADAWVKFDATSPAASDGHKISAGELRQVDYHSNIDDFRVFGSGACTITLFEFGHAISGV